MESLNSNPKFEQQARWFDGSILLEADDGVCWLKVYKGKVIDRLEFMPPLGYTFKLAGSNFAWEALASGDRLFADLMTPGVRHFDDDPEMTRLGEMTSEFKVEGNLMEAARLTEALHVLAADYISIAQ